MNATALDDSTRTDDLFPFTLTRSALDIRIGILTLREKGERLTGLANSKDFPLAQSGAQQIRYPWDIFGLNAEAIVEDMEMITQGRISQPIPLSVQAICPENIFIEEGAILSHCLLNASEGPVYIGRNARIMEGALIRGPFALCEGATVKMGTKIYGATTVGPHCIVGGEIKNSVLFGYSNKAHDGYLGNAVIGEWCNLGAGTSNSNLKNTGGEVKVWNPARQQFIGAGLKCGLLMGDYSRCSINTSFTTGTVVGVCCNILAGGLTPKYIPSFSWGRPGTARPDSLPQTGTEPPGRYEFDKYEFDKALKDIANWKKFKDQCLTDAEIQVLKHIFEGY